MRYQPKNRILELRWIPYNQRTQEQRLRIQEESLKQMLDEAYAPVLLLQSRN